MSDSDILYDSERMHASSSSPALPLACTVPYQHNRPMPMLRPHWQTDTYTLVKPTRQTRIGVPDAYRSHAMPPATQITHKQTLVPPMQQKLHYRTSRAWPATRRMMPTAGTSL